MDLFLYVLRSIIALIIVIWLANKVLKYINQYSNKQTKAIQIIERISISKSSSLGIVKIVNQYYLMSFTENQSEILHEFTDEETKEIEKQLTATQETSESVDVLHKINFGHLKEKYNEFFEQKKS